MRKLLFFLLLTLSVAGEGQITYFAGFDWQESLMTKDRGAVSQWDWLQGLESDKRRYIRQEFLLHGIGDTTLLSALQLDTFLYGENSFSPNWTVSFGRTLDKSRLSVQVGSGQFREGKGMRFGVTGEHVFHLKDLLTIKSRDAGLSDEFLQLQFVPRASLGVDWSFSRSLGETGFEKKFSDLYFKRALDYGLSFEDMKEFRDGDWEDVQERAPRNVGGTPIFLKTGARLELMGKPFIDQLELALSVGLDLDLMRWARSTKRGQGSFFFGFSARYSYQVEKSKNKEK